MPPEIWVIMGRAAVGKSSTIRALTGAYNSRNIRVQTIQGILDIFVQVRSLQEIGVNPVTFIHAHLNDRYILLSLRSNSLAQFPNGLVYLRAFINSNWIIKGIVVLDNTLPYTLPPTLSPSYINNSIPINHIARKIRCIWEWI